MGWNGHIWTETQEVAFVGFFVLRTVRDRTHTAHREQRLMGNGTEIQIRNIVWLNERVNQHVKTTQPPPVICFDHNDKSERQLGHGRKRADFHCLYALIKINNDGKNPTRSQNYIHRAFKSKTKPVTAGGRL